MLQAITCKETAVQKIKYSASGRIDYGTELGNALDEIRFTEI